MSLEIGALVTSVCGRDNGTVLAVIGSTSECVILADGRKRRLDKPKSKKVKHVRPLGYKLSEVTLQQLTEGIITNKMLYRDIKRILMSETV